MESVDFSNSKPALRRVGADARVRVAVVGCGAVAESFHLPVLAGHEGVELVALVDRNKGRAATLANGYQIPCVVADVAELKTEVFDAAIVATPPFHHAPCAIELMQRGIHVLVEKPMATRYQDAQEMVNVARQQGVVLSVGLFRRLLPSLQLMKAAIAAETLGKPLRFRLEGGAVYGWPAATLGNMRRDLAGGGVLADMGPHYLDQLLDLFDGPGEVLEYRDDARGGIESDCELSLQLFHEGSPVKGVVALSRTRTFGNELIVECERGSLVLSPGERYRVDVRPHDMMLTDPTSGKLRAVRIQASWKDEPETDWYETFRAQVDDWIGGIRTGTPPKLSGESALESVRLVEACYGSVKPMPEPWVDAFPRITTPDSVAGANGSTVRGLSRVLLTGATGFIGSRVAEVLALHRGLDVRALVNNPANASRLSRLPVEMVQADLRDGDAVRAAMAGCDAVVHCANSPVYSSRSETFAITVGGVSNLVDAAMAAGVARFVHLSTIAVHGEDVTGVLDESTPLRPGRGNAYGESKLRAERVLLDAVRRGLSPIILRPTCVFGPFGPTFITRPIEHLNRGRLALVGSAESASNTLFVDNLCEAIVCALNAADDVGGEVFLISDDDEMTWGEFYGFFARELGRELIITSGKAVKAASQSRGWFSGFNEIARSNELKALARKALWTDPVGRVPRHLLENSPRLKEWLKRRIGLGGAAIYTRAAADDGDLLEITPRPAIACIDKAKRMLGYGSLTSKSEALGLTLEWLRHSHLV